MWCFFGRASKDASLRFFAALRWATMQRLDPSSGP
jgi:hypothetical protein